MMAETLEIIAHWPFDSSVASKMLLRIGDSIA